ncbi:MAG TPA: hypothetical protein VIQ04_02800 [Nitrososphaeraceae archaeon]
MQSLLFPLYKFLFCFFSNPSANQAAHQATNPSATQTAICRYVLI